MTPKIKKAAILIWVVSTASVLYGSLSPKLYVPDVYNVDKLIHGGAYAGLAILSFFFISNRKYLVAFLFLLVAMGGIVEIIQSYIPARSGTIGDFWADFAGVIIGSLIAEKIKPQILGWFK